MAGTHPFYLSKRWRAVRRQRIQLDGWRCTECGVLCIGKRHPDHDPDNPRRYSPHVDHIKPLRQCPELALELSNLRTLCHPCHSKRTRLDQTTEPDMRKPEIGLDGYPVG